MALPATKDRPDGELAVFDQLLDSFFDWPLPAMRVRAVTAPMDIYERDGKYVLELATPGYDPQDINVEVSGATVTVSGQHKETIERKDVKYHRREMRRGAFARTVTLRRMSTPRPSQRRSTKVC